MAGALLGMEGGALRMVARVAKQRAIQVTRHWQTVGIPLESLGTERFPTLAACHGCGGKFRTLFHVKPEDGPAATGVAEEVVSAILERISERVEGEAEEGMRTRLRQAMQGQGVFVCFCCAAPVVREKRRRGDGLAARGRQPPQQTSAPRAGDAPRGRPSPTRILPQRARGSPVRFVPAADRAKQHGRMRSERPRWIKWPRRLANGRSWRNSGRSGCRSPPYHRRHRLARLAGGQNLKEDSL